MVKDKIMVKSLGEILSVTKIGMNDQFPKVIFKGNRLKGKRVALVVDKLYIVKTSYAVGGAIKILG
jgi:hypothetical protein